MPKAAPKETALIIDANSLIHRAWHALPPLTAPDGTIVNAVYGFASILMKILGSERPDYLAVCWDTPEPTYRHVAKKEYKAQRVEQPKEFYQQFPLVKAVVDVYGGTNVELPGYEADDLLATFACRLADHGVAVTLLTSDRDVLQLIQPKVRVMAFKKGVSETLIYDEKVLKELTGLTPEQIADYKALRGDASDNLKGVPGIGEKTATDLLVTYKDLEGVFTAAHDPKSKLSPSLRQKLVDGEQEARDTLPIVRLICDAPVKITEDDLKRRPVDEAELRVLFAKFGFKTLLARALGGKTKPEEVASTKTEVSKTVSKIIASTASDLAAVIEAARAEGALIVQTIEALQESLFQDAPVLALGSEQLSVTLTMTQIQDAKDLLNDIFADASIKKIGHGLKATWHWAKAHGLDLDGIWFDTAVASSLISDREEGETEIDGIRVQAKVLANELREQNLDAFMTRFETPLIPILAEMEEHGILIDRDYFKSITDDFRKEKARLEQEMEKLAGEPFNAGSPQQLGHILFDVLNISSKGIKRGKTGISTAASELEKLEGLHPIVSKIGEYREVAKLLSTYVEALPALADKNGRVHTTYNQIGAATGRMSSTNPNLQNIPIRTELGRKIRRGFIASKGYALLSCDYSQIELRVVAALAKDEKMLDAFRKNLDIHTATAAAIWHVPLEEVTKDQRRAAKAINFGIIYGQGPVGLSKAAGISFDEAKRFIDEYFHVYAGVRNYLDETKALAHARGYVETLFGRRRPIPDINSPLPQFRAAAERMAINMPVQGTATADLMKLAMIEIAKQLPKISKDTRLLLQVHDELVFEVPEKEVKKIAPKIIDVMQNVEKIGVPIVVDAKFGKNWEEMERVAEG